MFVAQLSDRAVDVLSVSFTDDGWILVSPFPVTECLYCWCRFLLRICLELEEGFSEPETFTVRNMLRKRMHVERSEFKQGGVM